MGDIDRRHRRRQVAVDGVLDRALSLSTQIVWPALPAMAQSTAAGVVFMAGLAATQYVGFACRVSCAAPIAAPLLGGAAVGMVSAAAGQAGNLVRRWQSGQPLMPDEGFPMTEILLHGALGMVAYKALGGSFRNLLPSDLMHPGALARFSLPALRGPKPANEAERDVLGSAFRRFGCHHCGKRTGNFDADHIPPSKNIYGEGWASKPSHLLTPVPRVGNKPTVTSRQWHRNFWSGISSLAARLRPSPPSSATSRARAIGRSAPSPSAQTGGKAASPDSSSASGASSRKPARSKGMASRRSAVPSPAGGAPRAAEGSTVAQSKAKLSTEATNGDMMSMEQRFFPQCKHCSLAQGQAVKQGKQVLILHQARGMPEPCKFTGFFVGLFPVNQQPPGGKTLEALDGSWQAASGPMAAQATKLIQRLPDRLRKDPELDEPSDAAAQVARMRRDLTEEGRSTLRAMEEEIQSLRAHEAQVRTKVAERAAARGDAHFGALHWMEEFGARKNQSVKELNDELQQIAKRKDQLKTEIRWLRGHLR